MDHRMMIKSVGNVEIKFKTTRMETEFIKIRLSVHVIKFIKSEHCMNTNDFQETKWIERERDKMMKSEFEIRRLGSVVLSDGKRI